MFKCFHQLFPVINGGKIHIAFAFSCSNSLSLIHFPPRQMLQGRFFKKVSNNGPSSNTMDFEITLQLPQNILKTKAFQESAMRFTLGLILENLATYSYSIAFPDLAFPVVVFLRSLLKSFEASPLIKRWISMLLEPVC
jgi:hypothetical protein